MATTCEFCGDPVDPKAVGIMRREENWVENRAAGGPNMVSDRTPVEPRRYAHSVCFELTKPKPRIRLVEGLDPTVRYRGKVKRG